MVLEPNRPCGGKNPELRLEILIKKSMLLSTNLFKREINVQINSNEVKSQKIFLG